MTLNKPDEGCYRNASCILEFINVVFINIFVIQIFYNVQTWISYQLNNNSTQIHG